MSDTDLQKHVDAKGRDALVRDVRRKIDELGIQYIYYQFVSVTGRIVGKGIPSDHWEAIVEAGQLTDTIGIKSFALCSLDEELGCLQEGDFVSVHWQQQYCPDSE